MANLAVVEGNGNKVVSVQFKMNSEKKHSVRYDAVDDDAAVTSAYVMKKDLPKPYPQSFKMQLLFD